MEFSTKEGRGGQLWVHFPEKIIKNNIGLKHLESPKRHFKTNSFLLLLLGFLSSNPHTLQDGGEYTKGKI